MVLKLHKYFTVLEFFVVHYRQVIILLAANFQLVFNRGIIEGKTIGWGLLVALLLYNKNMSVLLPQMTIYTLFTKEGGNIGI